MAKKPHDPTYDVKGPNIEPPPEAYDVKGPDITVPGVDPITGEMTGGGSGAGTGAGTENNPYGSSGYYGDQITALGDRPTYEDPYAAQRDALWDDIVSRKFSYDANADALYKTYRDRYMQQGKMAMQNTMGQAAGLTGGYGNTYAQGVGQQAYDQYLTGLADKSLDLRNQAFNEWQAEGDQLAQQWGMLKDMSDREWDQYLQRSADWASDRDYYTGLREDALDRETADARYLDAQKESALEMLRLYGIEPPASLGLTEEEMAPYRAAYQKSEDKEKSEEVKKEIVRLQQEALATGIMPSPEKLAELGVDESVFQPYVDKYQEGIDRDTTEKDEKKREAAEQKVVSYMQMGVVPTDDELADIGRDRAWATTILKYYGFNEDGTAIEQPTTGGGGYYGGGSGGGVTGNPPPNEPPTENEPKNDPITGRTGQQQADLDGLYELLSPVNGSRIGSGGWSLNPEISSREEALNIIREAARRGLFGDDFKNNKDYQALVKIAQRYPMSGNTRKPGDPT